MCQACLCGAAPRVVVRFSSVGPGLSVKGRLLRGSNWDLQELYLPRDAIGGVYVDTIVYVDEPLWFKSERKRNLSVDGVLVASICSVDSVRSSLTSCGRVTDVTVYRHSPFT